MGLDYLILEELKECEKFIIKVFPKKGKQQFNHKQQTIILTSVDSKYAFEIFTRQNIDLPNNFSVGLIYKGLDKSYILCRYNGDHGIHRNKLGNQLIKGFHKHIYNKEYIDEGLDDDSYAEETDLYQTMDQALYGIFKDYNITNYPDHFNNLSNERSLFNF